MFKIFNISIAYIYNKYKQFDVYIRIKYNIFSYRLCVTFKGVRIMIKPTKNNVAKILRNRLKDMLVVRHVSWDSYDTDLTVWNRRKKFLTDDLLFIDISSDYVYFIIRKKWRYEGIAKKSIPEADIDKMKPRTSYIPLELEDFDLEEGRSYLRVRDEIYKRINVVIHIMNFMSKNKTRGVMYEIYDYMRGVVEDYERLLKMNIL